MIRKKRVPFAQITYDAWTNDDFDRNRLDIERKTTTNDSKKRNDRHTPSEYSRPLPFDIIDRQSSVALSEDRRL